MITKDNFKELIIKLGFSSEGDRFLKKFKETAAYLKVDFKTEKLIYPEDKGFKVNERQTCSFTQRENFVVFECVHRLFEKGYNPQHIELEPRWKVGHGASGGRADIMVKDNSGKSLLIIECKTEGKEFDDAWKKTLINGGQLISYVKQAGSTQFVCLYSSDYLNGKVVAHNYLITLKDNEKLLLGFAFINKDISNSIYSTGFFVLNSKGEDVVLNKLLYLYFMHYTPLMEQMESNMGKGQYPSVVSHIN